MRCSGLSQWGSVSLAKRGLTPYEILQNYYGNNINLIDDAEIGGVEESYPGRTLQLGSAGDEVRFIQERLNRISKNYPNIPNISNPIGEITIPKRKTPSKHFSRRLTLHRTGSSDVRHGIRYSEYIRR